MKTTTIVPVTVCDLCGMDGSIEVCRKCKKDACYNCYESFIIHSWRGDGGDTPSFDGQFCITCSPSIVAAIVELGLAQRPVRTQKPTEPVNA